MKPLRGLLDLSTADLLDLMEKGIAAYKSGGKEAVKALLDAAPPPAPAMTADDVKALKQALATRPKPKPEGQGVLRKP